MIYKTMRGKIKIEQHETSPNKNGGDRRGSGTTLIQFINIINCQQLYAMTTTNIKNIYISELILNNHHKNVIFNLITTSLSRWHMEIYDYLLKIDE
jgi:hypothetical protein